MNYDEYQSKYGVSIYRKFFVKLFSKISRDSIFPFLRIMALKATGVTVGRNFFVGVGCFIDDTVPKNIIIGNDVTISFGVMIIAHKETRERGKAIVSKVYICDGAFIGAGAIILPGVIVGENSVVGAGAIVSKDVPNNTTVLGKAAKVL